MEPEEPKPEEAPQPQPAEAKQPEPEEALEPEPEKPEHKPGMRKRAWWTAYCLRMKQHREKKKAKAKAERQADLDFLVQTANENQGFALLPASPGPSRSEVRAERLALARDEAFEKLAAAKAEQAARWEKQLKSQTKLTAFFKRSENS